MGSGLTIAVGDSSALSSGFPHMAALILLRNFVISTISRNFLEMLGKVNELLIMFEIHIFENG